MAKRFSDSEKWKNSFLRGLKAPYKLLWLYLLDECDHAGIWQVDFQVAQLKIGEKLKVDEALKSFGDRIRVLDGGERWFVVPFIEFQYGPLNQKNRVHQSVIGILERYNLIDKNLKIKDLISPLQGVKEKDKDKDKDKDKEKEMIESEKIAYPSFEDFWNLYDKKVDREACERKWLKIPQRDREIMMNHIPGYKREQPDKQYRKNPETYLNNRSWQNEIIKTEPHGRPKETIGPDAKIDNRGLDAFGRRG